MKALVIRFVLAVTTVALGQYAMAAKHPVPLEPKTDSAKCLECHEDKGKGTVVHSAIATGCTSCHEIRTNKDITRVKLITTTTQALCFTCHADKNPAEIKGKVHSPAVRDCQKCHDPHTSANKNVLLKATSGAKGENLCLDCHTQGTNVPEKGSRHAALDMGCETCHVTHKTGERGKPEFDFHLTKAAPQLCIDCHDPKDAAIAKAHQNQPIANANCLTCHDPHQSAQPKLMQAFTHQPFGDKTCEACHAEAKDGKVVLTQADSKAVCVTCHEDKAKEIESAKVPHAGAQGDCITCHDPHAGKSPGFVKPDSVAACTSCHADQAEMHKTKKVLHQPAFEQGCATCHAPHGGDNPKLLRANTENKLCLECHGPEAKPEKVEGKPLVTIFNGKVRLPENYFRKVTRLPIQYGLGHPVERHPIQDQMDPEDVNKVRVAINCGTCHQSHAGMKPGMLVKDQENNMMFCASCHKDLGR